MFRLGERLFGRFYAPGDTGGHGPVLRGNMHRAIILRSPDDTFAEAVFLLKEDFISREGVSRKELLRQAGEAASLYCGKSKRAAAAFAPAAMFLLGAAAAIMLLWAFGLLA